nr:hypothetical protein [Bacteroidales bacterium]
MRKIDILDKEYNKSELTIPMLGGKTYLYWFETDPTNVALIGNIKYDLWKKQYDYLKRALEVTGYTYSVGAKTIFDKVAVDVNGNDISYFDIFGGASLTNINGLQLNQDMANGNFASG